MSASEPLNPYAPPAAAADLDFREAAVLESLRLWEAHPGRSAEELGTSLVLPADESGPAWLRHIGRMTVVRLVLGVGGLVTGALLAALSEGISKGTGVPSGLIVGLAAPFSIGGIAILFVNVIFARRTVRRGIGDRYLAVERHSTLRRPLCVGVEDARTFSKMKIAPEDMAWVAFDSVSRRLVLEGLIFRYIIHAADVLGVEQVAGGASTGVQVVFRVGAAVVGITLQYDSTWQEFKKQTIGGGRDPLLQPIHEALGMK